MKKQKKLILFTSLGIISVILALFFGHILINKKSVNDSITINKNGCII